MIHPQVAAHLIFIDEVGAHWGLTRLYARALPGQRISEAVPGGDGKRYTLVSAVRLSGLVAPWLLPGALDAAAFEVYIAQCLLPELQAGDIVIIDNARAHIAADIRECIEARGARLVFLPPYSPDLNPIELCWAKFKSILRRAKARTDEALSQATEHAFAAISTVDILHAFAHCGYAIH